MRRALLLLVLVLAACGGDDETAPTFTPIQTAPPPAGVPAPGGGLSVQEAIDSDLDGPLMVRGYVIEREGVLRLCSAILESNPPQCGEPSLRIEGDVERPARDEQVSLLGDVEDGVIRVSGTSLG